VPTDESRGNDDWTPAAASHEGPPDLITAEPTGLHWLLPVATAMIGLALGAVVMRYVDDRPRAQAAPIDVRVSLASQAGAMSIDGNPVVSVPLVIINAGSQPVTLTAIRVGGAGASLVPDPEGRPSHPLPAALVPGQPLYVRIAISSDCSVAIRPEPRVTLLVTDASHGVHLLNASIPDLDSIWGQTLLPGVCGQQG
jgi:hypothetical protein